MYATIDIGNSHMTRELLKGNLLTLMYAGWNVDSHAQYVSCQWEQSCMYTSFNEDSHVQNSTLRKIIWQAGSMVNASQVIPIYNVLENFNPKMSFCVTTQGMSALGWRSTIWVDNRCSLMCEVCCDLIDHIRLPIIHTKTYI